MTGINMINYFKKFWEIQLIYKMLNNMENQVLNKNIDIGEFLIEDC